jgi:hypothetical protein
MHHQHRRFGNGVELAVSNHHGHFNNAVVVRIQPGHFHVQPDEVVLILCHNARSFLLTLIKTVIVA